MTSDEPNRYLDEGSPIWRFAERILVVCPGCEGLGIVAGDPPGGRAAFHCTACARTSGAGPGSARWGWASLGLDPFFGLPLWLQTPVRGHLLWVWNEAHLEEIDRFVGASLRERGPAAGNASMASRLPEWMKRANARAPVRRGLEKLRARLPGERGGP